MKCFSALSMSAKHSQRWAHLPYEWFVSLLVDLSTLFLINHTKLKGYRMLVHQI